MPLFSFKHGGNLDALISVVGDFVEESAELALLFFGDVPSRVATGGAQVQ